MQTIDHITRENLNKSFNISDILKDSIFYPASGIDATDVECLSSESNSFVHVDYSIPENIIESGLRNHFEGVGYDLIGLRRIKKNELTPNGYSYLNLKMNEHERQRLESKFIRDNFSCRYFIPFALWAIYELNQNKTGRTKGKIKRFSLLHIGGEACATLEAVYVGNKINPLAISIISPGEGYGDNWTIFRDTEFRLYQTLLYNHKTNNVEMPKYLLTNMSLPESCFWPEYCFNRSFFSCDAKLYMRY